MDFFAAQDRAQRKSRWLVFWFGLAVMCIITVVYLCVSLWMTSGSATQSEPLWNGKRFFWVFLVAGGGISAASLFKIWQISRRGGTLIAEQLGGRMITRETDDPSEKRLLNVIDEMSIAAGIPAPLAFVLDEEPGLNAFAAGLSIQDCVIGVTHGLLETMNRDELQGVIGHEISHIVNGDSRLNLKLIGVLFGIYALTLAGRALMRVRGRNTGLAILLGLMLCVIGFIGLFYGRLIQAGISREREYLADAFSVQFTRHPAGLIAALNKLRGTGSKIRHPQAVTTSHLFFGASGSSSAFLASLFATHPPLSDRIRRLGGLSLQPEETSQPMSMAENGLPHSLAANPTAEMPVAFFNKAAPMPAASVSKETPFADIAHAQSLLASLPESLRQQTRHATGATGIIGGLLFSGQPDVRLQQEKQLPSAALPTAQELHQWLSSQPEEGAYYRIVWLDLALPTLREEPEAERQRLLVLAAALIRADGRMSPSKFALYSLLRGSLLPPSARRTKRGELRAEQLDQDIASLLALIAYAGHDGPETAKAAYQAAIARSPARAPSPFPEKTTLSLTVISQALAHLALATPPYRKKLLHACMTAICFDGKITPVENELLRAFAQNLDCPAPSEGTTGEVNKRLS
ncbi:MAG: M48 family metallopeptidase [Azoarcus sp.]|jgi:Zn-dependent protease with chaperone function|nr:M48 family metallopeptidase [Azoarcus sp.]